MTEKKTIRLDGKTIVEKIEVAGSQLIGEVKRVLREGNVRRLRLKDKDGDFSVEMPVTVGVIAGGAVALTAPWLAVLGVVAGLIANVEIEIERVEAEPEAPGAAAAGTTAPGAGDADGGTTG